MSLTDAERATFPRDVMLGYGPVVEAAVERIVAERVRQAKAEALREAADEMPTTPRESHWRRHAWGNWLLERADQYDRGSE